MREDFPQQHCRSLVRQMVVVVIERLARDRRYTAWPVGQVAERGSRINEDDGWIIGEGVEGMHEFGIATVVDREW